MRISWGRTGIFRVLGLSAVLALGLVAGAPSAPAEDSGLPGFLFRLFGGPPAKPQDSGPTPLHKPSHKRDFVPATTTRAPGAPGGAPVEPTFHVEVIGDSLAVQAADGLKDAFADKPEIAVVDKARDASGLVRDDYFDWPKFANDLASGKDKIDFVVVMLGINDLQPMRDGADTLDALSDRWRDHYSQRVEAVVAPLRAAHIAVAWVGLPPMRTDRVNAEAIKLNEIYKEHAEKAGAKYIDIWDAFADQNGQYDAFGPNIDGQNVKLRGADGIRFTKAGARKVAHFLEAEIKRSFDKLNPASEVATLPPDIEQAADDINAQIRREMGVPAPAEAGAAGPQVPNRPLAGPILSLTARPSSQGGELASRQNRPLAEALDVTRVFRVGEPDEPRAGRADDFSWPRL